MAVNNSFKEAKDAIDGIEWDDNAPTNYANVLYSLNEQQRRLILSTKDLSEENRKLVDCQLEAIRESLVRKAANKAGIDQDKQDILVKRLKVSSYDNLNKKIVLNAAATSNLTDEQKKYFTAALLAKSGNEQLSFSFETLKANTVAAFRAMITNPMFWVSATITGISLLVQGIEAYRRSVEDALQESVSKHQELTDQVTDLESELKSVGDRMKELSELDAPTVSDQEELDRLRETNEELERELRIKTALKEQAAVDAENAAKKWLGIQTFGYEYDSFGGPSAKLDWNVAADRLMSSVEYYQSKLEDAKNAMDAASDDVTSSAFKAAQKQAEIEQQNIDDKLKELSEIYTTIKENVIDAIGDQADTEWGKQILTAWDEFEDAYDKLLADRDKIEVPEIGTEDANVEVYTAQLSKLTDVISGMKSAYDALESAQADVDSGAGLSVDTIEKLAKENENYLDYLYEENGAIKLNTEAWKENANAKMQNEMAEIQKEIDSLNERNKVLLESIEYFEQMKDTDSNVGMWDHEISQVRTEIEKNTEAVEENQDKMSLYEAIFRQIQSDSDETFSSITDHLTFITGQYDLLTKAQNEFTESGILSASTLSSIADKFPKMEDSVNLYIAGLKTSQELLDELSVAYGTDFENYQKSIAAKLQVSEGFYNSLTDDQKRLIDELGKAYGINLGNFKTIESKKVAFQAEIIKQLAANYSKYANASLEGLKSQYDAMIISGGDAKELKSLGDAIYAIDKYNTALNNIASGAGLITPYDPKKIKSSTSKSGGGSAAKEVEEYTAAIDQYREAKERLRQVQEDRSVVERKIDGTDDLKEQIVLQKQLISVYQQEQSALHNLNDQRDSTIKSGVQSLRELGFAVQYDADTNELWISNMEHLNEITAKSRGKYESLQEATNALRKDTESLIDTITDLNDENRDGSSAWWDLQDAIHDAKVAIVNDLQDIVNRASEAVDEIQNVSDTLYAAADEFAANDGFITVDTYQSLLKLGPQYMQMLKDENGLWQINEERINDVIAARTRQMAVENAMSYVERIKLATQEGAVENLNDLIFVTTDAANSTWGLVYAELELMHAMGDLNDSQYQAALHNIQAMQDLAENAVQNIGKATDSVAKNLEETRKQLEATKDSLQKTLDELGDMQDGAGDLIDYVMEMLKHRIQQQIDLLEEMKDKYSEIIALKKESLDATRDEQNYQKTISKKLKEMSKLQERINALSLDDSRSAQAERAKLLEDLADLQEDLADTQADKAVEATKDSLDKMEEEYHAEKDKEIEILENSISSTQKLYSLAIDYIRNNWDTLYSELISWNTEWGTSLNSEITEAWDAAQAAAERYGDFVTAIMGGISSEIDSITRQIEALDEQMSSLNTSVTTSAGSVGAGGAETGDRNTTVGVTGSENSHTNEDSIHATVKEMYQNSQKWHGASADEQKRLNKRNLELGARLNTLGVNVRRDEASGAWYVGDELLYDKYRKYIYHTGGFVGNKPLKPNERYIKAEDGELILTSDQQDSFAAQIERIGDMAQKFMSTPLPMNQPILSDFSGLGNSTVSNVTNNNSQPVQIHFGDTIINGGSDPATVIADEVRNISRSNLNQIARMLRIKM